MSKLEMKIIDILQQQSSNLVELGDKIVTAIHGSKGAVTQAESPDNKKAIKESADKHNALVAKYDDLAIKMDMLESVNKQLTQEIKTELGNVIANVVTINNSIGELQTKIEACRINGDSSASSLHEMINSTNIQLKELVDRVNSINTP